jgi:hypothetical protein
VFKGADAETGKALGLTRHGERGLIVGKRYGLTQNIATGWRASTKKPL